MFTKSLLQRRSTSSYQSLEPRCMLAGNVAVFENVHLYIRGDNADNQFEIVAEGDQLKIQGIDGTTINGQESYLVQGAQLTDAGMSFEGGLRAHLGPGHDDFMVKDALFEDLSIVYGGTGNDNVDLVDSRFEDKLTVQTFEGSDSISATGSHFGDTFFAITLAGEDSVSMVDSMLAGNSIVATGDDADSIHSSGNHYMGEVNLVLPLDGDDTVVLNNPVVGDNQLGVFLGDGDDTIHADLTDATIDGSVRIGGQEGNDQAMEMSFSDELAERVTLDVDQMLVFDNGTGGITGVEAVNTSFFNSESDNFQVANDVQLDSTQTINRISWSGSYAGEAFEEDNFTIEFYTGNTFNGNPYTPTGDPIATFNVGNDVNRVDTGITLREQQLFSYSADIDVTLEAGEIYWVSIFAANEDAVPENGFGGNFNHFMWGFQTGYTAFGAESELENTSVYTYGDFSTSDPGWFNDFASVKDAPQDFQLWTA